MRKVETHLVPKLSMGGEDSKPGPLEVLHERPHLAVILVLCLMVIAYLKPKLEAIEAERKKRGVD